MYIMRTSSGEAKALVADEVAFRMVSRIKGHQENKEFPAGTRACFVFDDDAVWGTDAIQIFVWKGDYVYLRED